ncbi:hypothetical protein LCM20_01510 [Halobacillus litoralis]|uniref:hypothetical protein n=1 Tax=Halobacillus litoralis TaxID=45668 RepID=UPI001CD301FD|nr:hypothetical protein [Halobacillus litoralis]MCA0969263.1 hypothetical protein [Halobacillus litoralis]
MKNPVMKAFVITFVGIAAILLLVKVGVESKLQGVKQEVLEENPEITAVEDVQSLGGLFEWQEYVLEVHKGTDVLYRIWAKEDGLVNDEEVIVTK